MLRHEEESSSDASGNHHEQEAPRRDVISIYECIGVDICVHATLQDWYDRKCQARYVQPLYPRHLGEFIQCRHLEGPKAGERAFTLQDLANLIVEPYSDIEDLCNLAGEAVFAYEKYTKEEEE